MKIWNPPESPLTIEYSEEMLRELEPDPARVETRGTLYGQREGPVVRLQSLRPVEDSIGVYFLRSRGDVFLTEANIDLFETSRALVALVTAGEKAGFFLRGYDGSLQAVRSFQEFSVSRPKRKRPDAFRVAGLAVVSALPIVALTVMHQPQRSRLSVREDGKKLIISWRPGATGSLKISDGGIETTIPVFAAQASVSYLRCSGGDVQVTLTRSKPRL